MGEVSRLLQAITMARMNRSRDNCPDVENIVLPATPTILEIVSSLNRTISQFLQACSTAPPLGKFESEVEAMKLFVLVVRIIEAITELAKIDLVLAPSANVLARAVFEISVKAAWIVTPSDPFEREVRWLAHLQEDERMHARIAGKVARFGGDPTYFKNQLESLRGFRTGVERLLPDGYSPLPGNPSVEQMLEVIGQRQVYNIYTLLASYVHGSHASTWFYRHNLGTLREDGEFIGPESWYLALWTSWKTLDGGRHTRRLL